MSVTNQLTNAVLKSIMTDGFAYRGSVIGSLDDIATTGFYITRPNEVTGGLPENAYQYGVLLHLNGEDRKLQVYVGVNFGNPIWVRTNASNKWQIWSQIAKVGGGKTLHFFRKRAERRVAA